MIATEHREVPAGIRVTALFNILHPGAIHTHRDVVLFLTGHRTGVTPDATVLIDDKSVAHFIPFESEYSISTKKNCHLDSREKRVGSNDLHLQYAKKLTTEPLATFYKLLKHQPWTQTRTGSSGSEMPVD